VETVIFDNMGDAEVFEAIDDFRVRPRSGDLADQIDPVQRGETGVAADATMAVVKRIKRAEGLDFVTGLVPE